MSVAGAVGWFGLAYVARHYAEGQGAGWGVAEWFAHQGKWFVFATVVLFMIGVATRSSDLRGGRRILLVAVEVLVVWVLVWRTMPSYVWLPRGTERDAFGHIRQTVEFTCGPVCLGNLLENSCGSESPTERDLARLSGTTCEGSTLTGLIEAAEALGLELDSCRVMSLEELRASRASAIVQISTLPEVKHATLFLSANEEVVEFIDPAYGYRQISPDRFRKIWYGKALIFRNATGRTAASGPVRGNPASGARR